MLFTLLGFGCLVVGMLFLSVVGIVFAFDGLGEWNIGGVPNSMITKAAVLAYLAVVVCLWVKLIHHAPFTISFLISG